MQVKYVKMIDNNEEVVQVEADRVLRFLDQGWRLFDDIPLGQKASQGPKYKMTIEAQVTSPTTKKKRKKTTTPKLNDVIEITDDDEGEDVILPNNLKED